MGKKHFRFFQTAETGNRTPNSCVKGSGANHYPRAPALEGKKTFGLPGLYKYSSALLQGHCVFISVLDERAHYRIWAAHYQKKHVFFSAQRALHCSRFPKKQLIPGDKKHSEKNKFISGDKNIFFSYVHFRLFFPSPSLTFFQIDQKFFLFCRPQ